MTETREARLFECEMRADENEERGHFIAGRPIVYGQRTNLGWFDEVIEAGALALTDLKDVRMLVGHNDQGIPVARSRNNNSNSTMQLMPKRAWTSAQISTSRTTRRRDRFIPR